LRVSTPSQVFRGSYRGKMVAVKVRLGVWSRLPRVGGVEAGGVGWGGCTVLGHVCPRGRALGQRRACSPAHSAAASGRLLLIGRGREFAPTRFLAAQPSLGREKGPRRGLFCELFGSLPLANNSARAKSWPLMRVTYPGCIPPLPCRLAHSLLPPIQSRDVVSCSQVLQQSLLARANSHSISQYQEAFLDEAELMASVTHPHLHSLLGMCVQEGSL
jgi:hypothetical protein